MGEPESVDLVEHVFHEALERDAEHRAGFLAEACAGNVALLAEVASLLASHDSDQSFLQKPAFHLSAVEVANNLLEEDGNGLPQASHVTGFRLVREVGHGGMGAVYEAFSDQGQRVAVKFVKRGMDTEFILRRFERERRILGALSHPYVARLLDGGATDDGIPYFVMEYVEGLPIDQYARNATLSTTERLNLFLKVCEAVSDAHQHRVIHRDLKPSNILVTESGVPKLLDFGVAKLLDLDSAGGTVDATATAYRVMTPEYASPAQLSGLPPSEKDDVYSLGVLLYILLTDHHPYRFRSRTPEDVLRSILTNEVRRPSEVVHELRGDLDKVVLKAMRKQSERRYTSVEEMAEDIRRHLAGQRVSARGDSLAYRVARFARRYPTYTLSTAAVVLLSILLSLVFWVRGSPEQLSPSAKYYKEDDETYRLYLMGRYFFNKRTKADFHKGIEYFQQAVEKDPTYAPAYAGMADCYGLLGAYMIMDTHVAFTSARNAANKALELEAGLAEAHNSLALVHWLYDWDWEAADREFRKAIELDPNYVMAHHWRGLFLGEMSRFDEAEAEMQKALELDPVSAPVYADYGRVLYWARRYDEALEKYRKASEMSAEFGAMTHEREYLYEQAGRLSDWQASVEKYGGFDDETREAYRRHGIKGFWRVIYRRWLKHPVGGSDRAQVFARVGDKDRAFEDLEVAITTRDHRVTQLRVNPLLDPLRSDPRFTELLACMKLMP